MVYSLKRSQHLLLCVTCLCRFSLRGRSDSMKWPCRRESAKNSQVCSSAFSLGFKSVFTYSSSEDRRKKWFKCPPAVVTLHFAASLCLLFRLTWFWSFIPVSRVQSAEQIEFCESLGSFSSSFIFASNESDSFGIL